MHKWLAVRTVDQLKLRAGAVVDLAADLLAAAQVAAEGLFPLTTIEADVRTLPIAGQTVDIAICVSALAYMSRSRQRAHKYGGASEMVELLSFYLRSGPACARALV